MTEDDEDRGDAGPRGDARTKTGDAGPRGDMRTKRGDAGPWVM